jgi:hypothetical protein
VVFLASEAPESMTSAIVDLNGASYLRFWADNVQLLLPFAHVRSCHPSGLSCGTCRAAARGVCADSGSSLHDAEPKMRDPRGGNHPHVLQFDVLRTHAVEQADPLAEQ